MYRDERHCIPKKEQIVWTKTHTIAVLKTRFDSKISMKKMMNNVGAKTKIQKHKAGEESAVDTMLNKLFGYKHIQHDSNGNPYYAIQKINFENTEERGGLPFTPTEVHYIKIHLNSKHKPPVRRLAILLLRPIEEVQEYLNKLQGSAFNIF